MLKSVPVKANIRQQFDIFRNQDTWWMTVLYIMTFGTFSGLAAQFGLLMTNLYGSGNTDIVAGRRCGGHGARRGLRRAGPVKYVFLGPLVGAGARVAFAPLTDRTGGAIWTLDLRHRPHRRRSPTRSPRSPRTPARRAALDAGFDQFL